MNWKRIIPGVVLAVFLTDTALIIGEHGYLGFFELGLANTATQLMAFDLVIALTLASIWMAIDARRRGRSAVPQRDPGHGAAAARPPRRHPAFGPPLRHSSGHRQRPSTGARGCSGGSSPSSFVAGQRARVRERNRTRLRAICRRRPPDRRPPPRRPSEHPQGRLWRHSASEIERRNTRPHQRRSRGDPWTARRGCSPTRRRSDDTVPPDAAPRPLRAATPLSRY